MKRKALHELRHRKVLSTAFGYAVFAFAAIEAIDIVTPVFGLPESLLAATIFVALAGFPVIIALAWSFDWTADGVTAGTSAPPSAAAKSQVMSWLLVLLLAAAVAYLSLRLYGETGSTPSGSAAVATVPDLIYGKSVAVLPFATIAAGENDDTYFSEGVAQEILIALAGVEGLRVAARQSSFAMRSQQEDVSTIGERLRVSMVLEGTVRRAGDQLRVSAQLVDTASGYQVWSQRFDSTRPDVFRVQEEIARSIVDALQLELGAIDASTPIVQPGTENVAAYELYLQGRHLLNARRLDRSKEAVTVFREAIELDEDYAQAWAGLADAWISIREIGDLSQFEATQQSHDAITRALRIDAQLPEAQTSLGLCILGGGDKADALAQFDRALSLDPDHVDAHLWRANTLRDRGNLSAATRAYNQALALDPLNPAIAENQAVLMAQQGRFAPAIDQLRDVAASHPDRIATPIALARVHMLAGMFEAAVATTAQALALMPDDAVALAQRAEALARLGQLAQARETLDRALVLAPENEIVLVTRQKLLLLSGDYAALDEATAARAAQVLTNPVFEGTDMLVERTVWAATAKLGLGDADAALSLLETALADPVSAPPTPDAAHRLALLARARRLTGDIAGASAAAQTAREVAARAREEGNAPGALDYALAAAAAATDNYGRAVTLLQQAASKGWSDVGLLDNDPSLEGLRGHKDFPSVRHAVAL